MIADDVPHPSGRKLPSARLLLLRLVIGSVFLVSGIAKIPVTPRFAQTIAQIMRLDSTTSSLCAGLVIGSELAVGSMLLLAVRVSAVARCAMVLTGIFLAVLGKAIVRGEEFTCNCFGVLALPNRIEFLVDVVLLLALISVAGTTTGCVHRWRRVWLFALAALAIPSAVIVSTGRMITKSATDYGPYLRRAELEQVLQTTGSLHLLLFIDIRGLQCSVCFDDFIALYDSLCSVKSGALSERAILALRKGSPGESPDDGLRKRWARETGIAGPILLIESGEFDALTSGKNLALVVNGSGQSVLRKEIPMGRTSRKEIVAALVADRL